MRLRLNDTYSLVSYCIKIMNEVEQICTGFIYY